MNHYPRCSEQHADVLACPTCRLIADTLGDVKRNLAALPVYERSGAEWFNVSRSEVIDAVRPAAPMSSI
jgi:hypothetical protein